MYCDLIGQSRWYKSHIITLVISHITLVNSHIPPVTLVKSHITLVILNCYIDTVLVGSLGILHRAFGLLNHIETSKTVSNYYLDHSCYKYCDLIGQSRWYKFHITLVNSHNITLVKSHNNTRNIYFN